MKSTGSITGNNNYLIQNSSVYADTVILGTSSAETVGLLSDFGKYESIQQMFSQMLAAANQRHPLAPEFGVTYSEELNRLISVPKTSDAYDKHPMRIQGTFSFHKKDFPGIGDQETPWDYAYRTQTSITLDTKSFQEYLGDIPNPYPALTYSDGMKTIISPPEFPPPVEVSIQSGNISIPFYLRRIPCTEYGVIKFGSTSTGHGFSITIEKHDTLINSKFNLTKTTDGTLTALLQRERLILKMIETRQVSIILGNKTLLNCAIQPERLDENFYTAASYLEKYYSYLLDIQNLVGCQFDSVIDGDFTSQFKIAFLLKNSLENRWIRFDSDFDNQIRCDYENITNDVFVGADEDADNLAYLQRHVEFDLQGCHFEAEAFHIRYVGARINNLPTVRKYVKKKRAGILITIRPKKGRDSFEKHMMLSGINYISSAANS